MKNLHSMKGFCLYGLLAGQAVSVSLPNRPSSNSEVSKFKSKEFSPQSSPPIGTAIDRSKWSVSCDSQEPGSECKYAIDGNSDTMWHTAWTATEPKPPHTIIIDMKAVQYVNGISVLPRQDDSKNGWVGRHDVFVSTDGKTWDSAAATGTWFSDKSLKTSNFETRRGRYVRLVANSEANGKPWTSIAEINVFKADTLKTVSAGVGQWGPTLDFPVIPVSGAVDPMTGKVLVWSADRGDAYTGGGLTLTSTWNPATGIITERDVSSTNHDMFCPGLSMDGNGQIVVTGGADAERTSLYNSTSGEWNPGPDMKLARGYQASAATSDGRVFTVGGSWSGGEYEKNGEIYDPKARTWTELTKTLVKPMLTADQQGLFRSDNHAWLFGWKQGTVFQAGPSTAMNWYYTQNKGAVKSAGKRRSDRGIDPDAMCGNAVMFDATKGKILTFGGSPNYQDTNATTNAHVITIGDPGTIPKVSFASNGMWYPRIFHNSVVLPDGTIFITGGQQYGIPFADSTPQLTPELYKPDTNEFIKQQSNSIIRVYHSIALLLPDGRIFSGGGGLCGDCDTNHFDAQIFTPNYLYAKDGSLATRPRIASLSAKSIKVGGLVTMKTNGAITNASLIRYGATTHSVNTDQRRIPLTLKNTGTNSYSFQVPTDPGISLPGYWMLFASNSAGVPSVSLTVKITTT